MKLATGAGKTKVMSLLLTWSYFHKLYEPDSPLSTNFLLDRAERHRTRPVQTISYPLVEATVRTW